MLALLSAMAEEAGAILAAIEAPVAIERAKRTFVRGLLDGEPVIAGFSRWGKTAAATTAAIACGELGATSVLFTGVAGAIAPGIAQGDLVLASHVAYHDLDARPLFARGEIPLLGVDRIAADATLLARLERAAATDLGLGRTHVGLVATGDQFISDPARAAAIREALPGALCVEMEGAAIAQVCFEHGVPFALARIISDDASHAAPQDFLTFLHARAAPGGLALVRAFLRA
ncbi:MAG TPA: 5'-methylthioadenosine/adenosylhomocysteine nucleosidase [Kofleriaceae bacterium]